MRKRLFIITILFLLFSEKVIFGADVTPNNDLERKVLDFFEKWRNGENDYLPHTLPSLNVLYIPSVNGSFSGKGVSLTYYASRMKVVGMNFFSVANLNVSLSNLSASGSLAVPMLDISADAYNIEGRALFIYSLRGSGKFHAIFKNISLIFNLKLACNGTHPNIDKLNLNFALGDIQVDLENSTWPVNKVLNKEGVRIIEGYREDILAVTEKNLVAMLDTYLTTVSPGQLLNIMQKHLCQQSTSRWMEFIHKS